MSARPLDAARDALIALQTQLIVVLAARNSSLEALPGKTAPQPRKSREGGKRRQGKQPGAPGAHLAWSENPDTAVRLFPQGACACGGDLADAARSGGSGVASGHRHPGGLRDRHQYEEHRVACRCGRLHTAAPPAGAGEAGTVTYGLNIQAWCVFLLAVHQAEARTAAARMPGQARGRRPALPDGPADPAHLQPGRA